MARTDMPGCSLDDPAETLEKIENLVLCAHICGAKKDCVSFNYLEISQSCLLFNSTPYKIFDAKNCSGFDQLHAGGKAVQIRPDENLSKYRRTCQSTTAHYNNIPRWSWLAVDGFYETDRNNGCCSQTDQVDQFSNGFMVDLVNFVSVSYVRILSTILSYPKSKRYQNLTIGITNTSWLIESPIRGKFPLCGLYLGPPPNATWIRIDCQPSMLPSRFLIVHQVPSGGEQGGYLALCEVEVYGKTIIPSALISVQLYYGDVLKAFYSCLVPFFIVISIFRIPRRK